MIRLDGAQDQAGGSGSIIAPMHGLLLEVRVARAIPLRQARPWRYWKR